MLTFGALGDVDKLAVLITIMVSMSIFLCVSTLMIQILMFLNDILSMDRRPGFNLRLCNTKDPKMVLDISMLNTQYYKLWTKGKWNNLGKEVPSPTPWGRSFCVTLDYGQPTYMYN